MGWSFSIGRILGSELKVHVTFLILLAWIGFSAYSQSGLQAAIISVLFILALFACVVAHEFGHALMARRYGIRTPDVTLLPIGGVARLDRMPERPLDEIAVAVAGPAVNVVIWALLTVFFGARSGLFAMLSGGDAPSGFLDQLATVNLYLLAFNLLPAFPMDGGRVLRALLSMRLGRRRGTALAARIGQILAVLFGLYGLSSGNPILILIAAFVFFAAQAENADSGLQALANTHLTRDAMITEYTALRPDDAISVAADAIIRTTQHEFPVIGDAGHPVGFLTRQAVFAAFAQNKGTARVGDLMRADIPHVSPRTPLAETMTKLAASPAQAVLVTDAKGQLVGYVTRENVGEMMLVTRRRA